MRGTLKRVVQTAMKWTPFRIVRAPENRFQAIPQTLQNLATLGYCPRVIVDGGAHLGDFALLAQTVFPAAEIHMIEPQPACLPALEALTREPKLRLHTAALVSEASQGETIGLAAGAEPSTGAHIEVGGISVPAATLDSLIGASMTQNDRALVKLDLQGYELQALRGGRVVLEATEVVLVEVSFFRQAYEPTIADLVAFLDAAGFELFDIAALGSRPRDNRPHQGDFLFIRHDSPLARDTAWE